MKLLKESARISLKLLKIMLPISILVKVGSNFGIIDYYYRKLKIGPIVSSSTLPQNILSYFNEIRETYAFGQYRSSIALCRALLEMTLLDKLKKLKVFADRNSNVISIDVAKEDNLFQYIKLAKWKRILDRKMINSAHEIRMISNKILHRKDESIKPTEKTAFKIISETVMLIETMYR